MWFCCAVHQNAFERSVGVGGVEVASVEGPKEPCKGVTFGVRRVEDGIWLLRAM